MRGLTNAFPAGGGVQYNKVLAKNSWAKIAQASQEGVASQIWSVGDEKDIVVEDKTLTVAIMGFDHDDLADGSGKAGITFGLKNLMPNTANRAMNSSLTNDGGFVGSEMYSWMQNTLLPSLSPDLQAVLKSVNKKTSAGNKSPVINTNAMKLFLFSEIEIFGVIKYSVSGEGSQYNYFTTSENRIKRYYSDSGMISIWWERSPWDSVGFCIVGLNGNASSTHSTSKIGVCFGFCV